MGALHCRRVLLCVRFELHHDVVGANQFFWIAGLAGNRFQTNRSKPIVRARKHSRYGHRDATAILIAYRDGLRASELCELTWNMIELDSGRIHVRRAKNGVDSTHPLTGKEIRALRQLRRENLQSRYVFNTERGGPVTRAWFLKM